MLSLTVRPRIVLVGLVVLSFPPSLNVLGSESSPSQVVEQWIAVYPNDLDTAVSLTTLRTSSNVNPSCFFHQCVVFLFIRSPHSMACLTRSSSTLA